LFPANVLLCFGVRCLLDRRDHLSGLLVAQPALILWLQLESDAVHSALGLALSVGAGLAMAVGRLHPVRS